MGKAAPYYRFSVVMLMVALGCGPQLRLPHIPPALVESERQRQEELALKLYFERVEQVTRITSLLGAKSAELCAEQIEPMIGVLWADRQSLPEDYWEVGERVFGIGDELRVLSVVPGFPAENGGVKPGDTILRINGSEITSGMTLFERTSKSDQAREMLLRARNRPVNLEISRSGQVIALSLQPLLACAFSVTVGADGKVNALTDGTNIEVTSGMLRFVKDDDELAIVLGHELAHNSLGHVFRTRGAAFAGGILGLLLDAVAALGGVNTGGVFSRWASNAGILMLSKDYESEADYLGLYFAARAGFDTAKAPNFWRRMAIEHPRSIKENFLAIHPSSPERAVFIETTIAEIRKKLEGEEPLLPTKRESVAEVKDRDPIEKD